MRRALAAFTRWALALAACSSACSSSGAARDAPPAPADAPPDASRPAVACANPRPGTRVELRRIGRVSGPAVLAAAPLDDRRVFVVEQGGAIRIFAPSGALRTAPFLDLGPDVGGPVLSGAEQGLLGLAFHPRFSQTGAFYIYYTAAAPPPRPDPDPAPYRNVVARCTANATDPDRADPASCTELLSIPDFSAIHNGGMIEFGPDGMLYIGTGDGGGIGDPNGNAQALSDGAPLPTSVALLGKLLRIDVDAAPGPGGRPYGIPADNPYAAGGGAPEIFLRGLRNPWRWSFDRATHDLWIADVGQDQREELTVLPPSSQRAANLGWPIYEGTRCHAPPCAPEGLAAPQLERTHESGWAAIVGGQVYRGACYPDLTGAYFYTDYAAGGTRGVLSRARRLADGAVASEDLTGAFPPNPTSLHEAAGGELYLTAASGEVYRLEAR